MVLAITGLSATTRRCAGYAYALCRHAIGPSPHAQSYVPFGQER